MELIAGIVGGIIALLEALQLFILSDLRDRLVRLENHYLNMAWTGEERRRGSTYKGKEIRTGDPQ